MYAEPAPPRWVRGVSLILLVTFTASCRSWGTAERPLPEVVAEQPEQVRVHTADGQEQTVRAPRIEADSLVGLAGEGPAARASRIAIPLDQVVQVEVQRISAIKTTLLAVGFGVTLLLLVAAGATGGTDPQPQTGQPLSCPLVYSWDGEGWRLDSGTFGGAIAPALARTDVDNLDFAAVVDGVVRLKVANELDETDYVDRMTLLIAEHEPGVAVAPDPSGELIALRGPAPPAAARDLAGGDVLPRVERRDGWSWESSLAASPAGDPPRDGVVLGFRRPRGVREARLVVDAHNTPWAAHLIGELVRAHGDRVDAWYASMEADPAAARRAFGRLAEEAFLSVAVETAGGWERQALLWEAGPEVLKRQAVRLDLTGVTGPTVRVRLDAPVSFWLVDHVAIDYGPEPRFTVHEIRPVTARTDPGRDVLPELAAIDDSWWVLEPGEAGELSFRVPEARSGDSRTLLLRSHGWYRIHARREGPPDLELLARIEGEPGGVARVAARLRAEALEALQPAR